MRRIRIQHLTRYIYQESVALQPHTLHLRPREGHDIRIQSSRLEIKPEFQIRWKRDVYGNSVAVVNFLRPTKELVITSEVIVEHYEQEPLEFMLEDSAQHFPFQYDPAEQIDLAPYQSAIYPQDQPLMSEWLGNIYDPTNVTDTITMLTTINRKIANELQYQMRETPGVQSPAQTLSKGSGSCRDFATLFIEICRYFGLASRFISGYAINETLTQEHSSTHAWSEVLLPGSGWRGFDSTSGLIVSGEHIAVAVHRHPEAIPPVTGTYIGSVDKEAQLSVEVRVAPVLT